MSTEYALQCARCQERVWCGGLWAIEDRLEPLLQRWDDVSECLPLLEGLGIDLDASWLSCGWYDLVRFLHEHDGHHLDLHDEYGNDHSLDRPMGR